MTRVLFISNSIDISGAEKILLSIIEGIQRKGTDVYFVCSKEGKLTEAVRTLNIKSFIIPMHFKNFKFRYFRHLIVSVRLGLLILKLNITLIYSNRAIVGKYASVIKLLFPNIKVIWHLHDFYNNYLGDKLIIKADRIISVSEAVRKSYPAKFHRKINVIYNGLKINFSENLRSESLIKQKYNIVESQKIVILPGRVTEWKGQKLFVETAKYVLDKVDNVKFLIVGDVIKSENYSNDLKFKNNVTNLISEYRLDDKIFISGWINDIYNYLKVSNIVLNCSIEPEPLATTILEAMALKKPIICTDSGGNSELVINKYNGIIITSIKPNLFGEAIINLLKDNELSVQYGENSFQLFNKKFNYDRFINEINREIESIIK